MEIFGLILAIISIIIVFFNYNIAILLFGVAMILWGIHSLQIKDKVMAYIYLVTGFVFIIGICVKGF